MSQDVLLLHVLRIFLRVFSYTRIFPSLPLSDEKMTRQVLCWLYGVFFGHKLILFHHVFDTAVLSDLLND